MKKDFTKKLLEEMYDDTFFPDFLVDKINEVLLEMCKEIEEKKPKSLEKLYVITHAQTEKINDIADEFYENGSEIETAARDCIGMAFSEIASYYDFNDADDEELIEPREW